MPETPRPTPTQARADYTKETVHGEDPGALAAPRNLDIPLVMGAGTVGASLTCTMGNWTGEPDGYSYQWKSDGSADVGTGGDTYLVAAGDVGHAISCVVTATNSIGIDCRASLERRLDNLKERMQCNPTNARRPSAPSGQTPQQVRKFGRSRKRWNRSTAHRNRHQLKRKPTH